MKSTSLTFFDEFRMGLISPIIGIVISILIYVLTVISNVTKIITPNNSFTKGLWFTPDTMISFFIIFSVIIVLIEFFMDLGQSYVSPSSGIAKICGTLFGTILFWGVLVQISTIIGSSQSDLVISFLLAIGAPLLGIYLRHKFRSH